MSDKYPFIPEHLERSLEDLDIPLIDLMHGHLKLELLESEGRLENISELQEFPDYQYEKGYMDALTSMYCLTYNLSIDRANLERTPHE